MLMLGQGAGSRVSGSGVACEEGMPSRRPGSPAPRAEHVDDLDVDTFLEAAGRLTANLLKARLRCVGTGSTFSGAEAGVCRRVQCPNGHREAITEERGSAQRARGCGGAEPGCRDG